jgi:hypothetical protein
MKTREDIERQIQLVVQRACIAPVSESGSQFALPVLAPQNQFLLEPPTPCCSRVTTVPQKTYNHGTLSKQIFGRHLDMVLIQ